MPGLYGLSSNANVSVYNTTGLYQLSNANVIVGNVNAGNTTGLYTAQGNVFVPTNAQALFNLLSESGNVQFALTNNNSQILAYDLFNPSLYNFYSNANVAGYLPTYNGNILANDVFTNNLLYANGQPYQFGSTYSNVNVAAYIPTDPTITTIQANIGGSEIYANATFATQTALQVLNANVGAYETWANTHFGTSSYSNVNAAAYIPTDPTITSIQANVGAFETYANATFATKTSVQTLDANVGAFETYANATFVTQATVQTLDANIGAYEIYANANAATQALSINSLSSKASSQAISIQTLNANLGAFEIYANATFGTSSYGNTNVAAYIPTDPTIQSMNANLTNFETYANATFGTSSYANANVVALLNQFPGNIIPSSNVTYSLGSTTNWWKDLYLSNNTLYLNGVPLAIVNGNLTLNNVQIPGTYSNANVSAYLPTSTVITGINANITAANTNIQTLNANVGAFETYANATFGTNNYSNVNVAAYIPTDPTITGIQANIGAFEIYANANAASQQTQINTINANIGAFEIYANANAASQQTQINTLQGQVYTNSNVTNLLSGGTYTGDIIATTGVVNAAAINSSGQLTAGTYLQANNGLYSLNSITEAYTDGIVVDYTTGNGRISVGSADAVTFYSGGPGATPTLILYPNGNIVNPGSVTAANLITTNGVYWANGAAYSSGSSTYGNTQVAAYLPTDPTITGIQANIGAYEIYANATFATKTALQILDANVGAFEIYANANIGSISTSLQTLNANIGAYEIYANANIGSISTSLQTLNANVGAFEIYANATFATGSYGNANVATYLPVYGGAIYANAVFGGDTLKLYSNTGANPYIHINATGDTTTTPVITIQAQNQGPTTGIVYIIGKQIYMTAASGNSSTNTFQMSNFNPLINGGNLTVSAGYVTGSRGLYTTGTFIGSYSDGLVADYSTGNGRISVGTGDGINFYTGGVAATQILSLSNDGSLTTSGNATLGNVITTNGVFWANGTAYSTGGGGSYGNTQVAAFNQGTILNPFLLSGM